MPNINSSFVGNLHPVHQVKNSFLIKILTSFEGIVRRMNDQTLISV